MKTFKLMAAAIVAAAMAACGNNATSDDPQDMADLAIEKAEATVEAPEYPNLGKLPVIALQEKTAIDSLGSITRAIFTAKAEELKKDGEIQKEDQDKAMLMFKEMDDKWKEAKEKIHAHYTEAFEKEAAQYIGQEISCAVSDNFKSAEATITGFKDNSKVEIEYHLTAAKPIGRFFTLRFCNEKNEQIAPYAQICKGARPGETIDGKTAVLIRIVAQTKNILID